MALLALVNAVPLLFLFWPSLLLFAGVGFLELYAGGNFMPLWLAGAAGAFAGDVIFYYLRRGRRNDLSKAWYVNEEPEALESAGRLVERQGVMAVIVSKALGLRRAIVPLMAGARDMQLGPFLAASIVSCLLWSGALLSLYPIYDFLKR
jgi:membrane protein DedA with SNARE-associated domain